MRNKDAVIVDGDHELTFDRVCAVDVAKASGMVCVRRAHGESGRRSSQVWEVPATTAAVIELAGQLVAEEIEKVTIESTSDYWRIWFYLLEAAGLDVQLVNARDVKNVPGRSKTDKLDAVWLAKLTEKGLLRASFVPPVEIRQLRDYTRMRIDLTRDRTRHEQRLEKLLEDALIKVTSVASAIDTKSVRAMIEALIAGERDPYRLAALARGRMKVKRAELIQALTGRFDTHHAELARILLDQIDALSVQINQLNVRVGQLIAAIPAAQPANDTDHPAAGSAPPTRAPRPAPPVSAPRTGNQMTVIERLDEIPGIGPLGAATVIAEIGLDMTRFPTAGHLVSWAKLCPRTIQSGPKQRAGKTGKGNPYLKGVLGEAAAAAARTPTFLGERYRRLVRRRGKLKALVAVARSILVAIWQLLSDPTTRFIELGPDYYLHRVDTERQIRNHLRQLEALGYHLTTQPAA